VSDIPKCTSIWGHKFVARYSSAPGRRLSQDELFWLPYTQRSEVIAAGIKRTYEHDICVRCGHVVEHKTPPKSTD
jgi:hypothetical protein